MTRARRWRWPSLFGVPVASLVGVAAAVPGATGPAPSPWPAGADALGLVPVAWVELEIDGQPMTFDEVAAEVAALVAWQQPSWWVDGGLTRARWRQARRYLIDTHLLEAQARRLAEQAPSAAELEAALAALPGGEVVVEPDSVAARVRARHVVNARYLGRRLALEDLAAGAGEAARPHWLGEAPGPRLAALLRELGFGASVRVVGPDGLLSHEPVPVAGEPLPPPAPAGPH